MSESSWQRILSGILQRTCVGLLLFLIYVNDLPDQINSICKIYADDTSLLFAVDDKISSWNELNNNLQK